MSAKDLKKTCISSYINKGYMNDTHLYFFIKIRINKIFSLKCDVYYALTFQRLTVLFKMQVTFIC